MAICLIDTSVFCNILSVPNRSQQRNETLEQLELHIEADDDLLLPMTTVYETGNHIAQNGTGGQKRECALRFVKQVRQAFLGEAPWVLTPVQEVSEILEWLESFPNDAMRGVGFGDLSIIKIYEQQCQLHPYRHVLIWSYDEHLRPYQHMP